MIEKRQPRGLGVHFWERWNPFCGLCRNVVPGIEPKQNNQSLNRPRWTTPKRVTWIAGRHLPPHKAFALVRTGEGLTAGPVSILSAVSHIMQAHISVRIRAIPPGETNSMDKAQTSTAAENTGQDEALRLPLSADGPQHPEYAATNSRSEQVKKFPAQRILLIDDNKDAADGLAASTRIARSESLDSS